AANAQLWNVRGDMSPGTKTTVIPSVGGGATPRTGNVCNFDVTGIPSHDGLGAFGNFIADVDLSGCAGAAPGTPVTMNGIGWDVTLFADPNVGSFGGSWLQELSVDFNDNTGANPSEFFLRPGAGNTNSGTASFSSGGVLKLVGV